MAATDEMVEDINTEADALAGEGDRYVVKMRMNIYVYKMSFFIDAHTAAMELANFRGRSFAELSEDASFYARLIEIPVKKGFRLTFQRALPAQKVVDVFLASLSKYAKTLEKSRQANVLGDSKQLLAAIPSLQRGDNLTVSFSADKKHVKISLNGEPLSIVNSNSVWCGLQIVYFGPNSEFPDIKRSVISKLPDIIGAPREEPAIDDTATGCERVSSFMTACGSETELEAYEETSASKSTNAQRFSLPIGDTFQAPDGEEEGVAAPASSLENMYDGMGRHGDTQALETGESLTDSVEPRAFQMFDEEEERVATSAASLDSMYDGMGRFPPPQTGQGSKTWKEFAGRAHGEEGYKLGDVSYGVMTYVKSAAQSGISRGTTNSTSSTWKDYSGREHGDGGYKFGDITKGLFKKATSLVPGKS